MIVEPPQKSMIVEQVKKTDETDGKAATIKSELKNYKKKKVKHLIKAQEKEKWMLEETQQPINDKDNNEVVKPRKEETAHVEGEPVQGEAQQIVDAPNAEVEKGKL